MSWEDFFAFAFARHGPACLLCLRAAVSLTGAKLLQDSVIGRLARLVHLMAQFVAVDPDGAQCLQLLGDGALPAAAASRQADDIRQEGQVGRVLTETGSTGLPNVHFFRN